MPDVLEYTYDERPEHLDDRAAIKQYEKALTEHPEALVDLRDLDCGHWEVNVYKSATEKNAFLVRRLNALLRTFWSSILPNPKTP